MKLHLTYLFLIFNLFYSSMILGQTISDIEIKLREDLINNIAKSDRPNWRLSDFESYKKNFAEGVFTDLDYSDPNNSTWGPVVHIRRLQQMATMYSMKVHKLYGSKDILEMINLSMDHWDFEKYQNHNWWMNEIGLPLSAYRILLLVRNKLKTTTVKTLLKITKQSLKFSARTGQNLVWYSEIFIGIGLILKDKSFIIKGTNNLSKVIYYAGPSDRDGLHSDGSFFQHGKVFYTGGYGLDFSKDLSRFVWVLSESDYQLPDEKIEILAKYILEGQLWLVRGDIFNYSSVGRYYARPNYSAKKLLMACEKMSKVETKWKGLFFDCVYAIKEKKFSGLVGNKYFWKSEFMVQQNKHFAVSVKLFSKHVLTADTTPNSEGLLNYYLSDGVSFIQQDGEEYKNIFPLLDWRRLPGTTETKVNLKPLVDQRTFGHRNFVGGLSNGSIGLSAMDFSRGKHVASPNYRYLSKMDFKMSHLQAKKSWFFLKDKIIALGAHINHTGHENHDVWTSINQTWSRGDITFDDGLRKTLSQGKFEGKINWFNHDSIAYVNLNPDSYFVLQNLSQKGNWNNISKLRPSEEIEGKVFSAWIEHGTNPKNEKYAYTIVPGVYSQNTAKYIDNELQVKVLENSKKVQAIEDLKAKIIMGAVYSGNSSINSNHLEIKSKTPILLIIEILEDRKIVVHVSNPIRTELQAELSLVGQFLCEYCEIKSGETVIRFKIDDDKETDHYFQKIILRRL